MKEATGRAPSKLILLGEHSVVYGHPAVAVPLRKPAAQVLVSEVGENDPVSVNLEDFNIRWTCGENVTAQEVLPFAKIIELAGRSFETIPEKGWRLSVRSEIPIGCGLGSGAAVSAAALSAICRFFGVSYTPQMLSDMVYETEKIHHGTPSGIDNTVIAMGRPVLFRKGAGVEFINVPEDPVSLVVGCTGINRRTVEIVSDVAEARAADGAKYDAIFSEIGDIVLKGAEAFQKGSFGELGKLMSLNQRLLEKIGVSSPELESLVSAAGKAGALGAKLSGAGRGGCMVALTDDLGSAERLKKALESAGAVMAVITGVLQYSAAGRI